MFKKVRCVLITFVISLYFTTFHNIYASNKSWGRFFSGGLVNVFCGYLKDSSNKDQIYTPSSDFHLPEKENKQNEKFSNITFKDIAGLDSVLVDVKEVLEYLKGSEKFTALGSKLPRGILLEGPPGNGKTLIAKAIANEAGYKFIYASASSFVEMYVGTGARRVRDLFSQASPYIPTIIFIDEIDAIGAVKRGTAYDNDEYRQTLNELLCQMDGIGSKSTTIVIGATNSSSSLDKALKRPGRFSRIIKVPNPDKKARWDILKHYLTRLPNTDVTYSDLDILTDKTSEFSAADLENMVNEATFFAARDDAQIVHMKHLEQALTLMRNRS
jgi:cell division protease FtsH